MAVLGNFSFRFDMFSFVLVVQLMVSTFSRKNNSFFIPVPSDIYPNAIPSEGKVRIGASPFFHFLTGQKISVRPPNPFILIFF